MIGTVLGDRYELLDIIGEGGMAVVYKARCKLLDRTVAVKILKSEFSENTDFIKNFKTEAFAAAQLSHPNIVNIFDVGCQDNTHYIVMEYVEGKTLKDIIYARAPLPIEEAVNITIMICDGLNHAHEKGIIHRDIKPHNILITDSKIVKVADFGIARAINQKTITYGGNIIGSVHYISPEQAKGEPVDPTSDIYSLGSVLYEMLTGKTPFDAESPITVALKHIHDHPVSPQSLNDKIPEQLAKIVLKAMEKKPSSRYSTAEEMRNKLLNLFNNVIPTYSRNSRNENTREMHPIGAVRENNADKKRKIRTKSLAILIVAFFGLLSGFLFVMGGNIFGKEIVVPDIVGMEIEKASEELDILGLKMNVIDKQYSAEFARDEIISQDPEEGQNVKEGREIKVILSKGTELYPVPYVVGLKLSDATLTLTNEGLQAGSIEEIFDDKYAKGFVISQKPAKGQVEKGTRIDLMVSKGEKPDRVSMPSLIGKSLEEARQILKDNGLSLGQLKKEESHEYYKDQVINQDTLAGVMIDQESVVNLVVSSGPGPVAKTKVLDFELPEKQDYYKVVIELNDAQGQKEIYNELHKAKDRIYIGVNYYGSAEVKVRVNGELYKNYNF